MKLLAIFIFSLGSWGAMAEQMDCMFTEPFLSIHISEDGKRVTMFSPGENLPNSAPVVESTTDAGLTTIRWGEEEDFHVLQYYLEPSGGSDGMSDRIYPYTGRYWVGDTPALVGGCSTPSKPVKEPRP